MNSKEIIRKVIKEFCSKPPTLDDTGDIEGDKHYVELMKSSYLRTLDECLKLVPSKNSTICELGSFFGILAKALSYSGYKVKACDIPFFYNRKCIEDYFKKSGVESFYFNLRDYKMPFEDSSQDLLIACEIFEHLNFNPLPVIKEINRVIKLGGYFYLSMPNASSFVKRLKYLIQGKLPTFTPKQLFEQLDAKNNMVVGLHWREYTLKEMKQMVEPFGFVIVSKQFPSDTGLDKSNFLKYLLKRIIFSLPGCQPNQIIIFKKTENAKIKLDINSDS